MGKPLSEADVRRIVREELAASRTVVVWGLLGDESQDDIEAVEAVLNAHWRCTCDAGAVCRFCQSREAAH